MENDSDFDSLKESFLLVEAKAQAKLRNITFQEWLTEAVSKALLSEHSLRRRLPDESICERCGRIIRKKGRGEEKMIIHHDWKGTRSSVVAMRLCPPCHFARHKELGWGIAGGGPGHRRSTKERKPNPLVETRRFLQAFCDNQRRTLRDRIRPVVRIKSENLDGLGHQHLVFAPNPYYREALDMLRNGADPREVAIKFVLPKATIVRYLAEIEKDRPV